MIDMVLSSWDVLVIWYGIIIFGSCCIVTAAGKSGGGTQGREVKTKSTKKKQFGRDRADSDSEDEGEDMAPAGRRSEQEFMSRDEIVVELKKQSALTECSREFVETIASRIQRQWSHCYSSL